MRLRFVVLAAIASLSLAGCPSTFQLGFPGQLPTIRLFIDDIPGINPVAVHYPDADPPAEGFPLVILDTGFNQPRLSYDGYGTQLAQWGYVCIIKFVASPGLTGIGDAMVDDHVVQNMDLIDWAEEQNLDPNSPLFGMIDPSRIAVVGHSLGAGIAIDTAVTDPRISACVSLDGNYPGPEFDPREKLPLTDAAFLFFYATEGRWCSGQRFETPRLFEYTVPPAIEVSVIGASHLDFMDSIIGLTYVAPYVCPRGSADAQDVRDIAIRYLVSWLNVYLKGQNEFADYFNGAASQADEAAGIVSIRYNLETD